jgi:hypothetical protein
VIFSGDRVRGACQIGEVAMPQMPAGFPVAQPNRALMHDQRMCSSVLCRCVLRQISRPRLVPLTWSGLIECQVIMAREAARWRSRSWVSRLLARLRGPAVSGLEPHRITFDAGQVAVRGAHRVLRADSMARSRQRADFNGDEPIYLARDTMIRICRK